MRTMWILLLIIYHVFILSLVYIKDPFFLGSYLKSSWFIGIIACVLNP